MDYGELFEKAWRIIWKHKVLWLFGILAGCSVNRGGGGSGSGTRYTFGSEDSNGRDTFSQIFPGLENFFNNLERTFQDGSNWQLLVAIGIALLCVILIFWVIGVVLGTFGRTGLVRGAWLADEGAATLSFGQLWKDVSPFFWRVFGLNLLLMLLGWVIGIILILPTILFIVFTLGCGLLFIIPLVIIVGWLVSVWLELAIVAIVGENLGIEEGIRRGWQVIRSNLGPTIVVSLIVSLGSLIAGMLIALPLLAVILPVVAGFVSQTETGIRTGIIAAVVLALLYLPVAFVLSGILQSYIGTVWTLFFRRMTGRQAIDVITPVEPVTPSGAEVYEIEEVNEPSVG